MGMFDEVKCKYALDCPEVQDALFQSKDTPVQYLDKYEIREDGTLWHEDYDVRWEESDDSPLGFWMHKDNKRWVQVPFVGELEIHHLVRNDDGSRGVYYSFQFWFRDGVVKDLIRNLPDTDSAKEDTP